MEVTISVKRDKGDAKTWKLRPVGESKKGTYTLFAAEPGCTDLPEFGKVYVNAKPAKKA